MKHLFFIFFGLIVLLGLSSCGGSGSPATWAPGAPTLNMDYGIKQVKFSWSTVDGASYYKLLENPDGVSGYSQVGDNISGTSYDHDIALYRRINASYILEACNSGGCTDSDAVSLAANLIPAIGYVKASNTQENALFGWERAVALSQDGNTLAVGAPGEASASTGINNYQADTSAPSAGAVYVFTRNSTGTWTQQAYVKPSRSVTLYNFGNSVALSNDGNTLVVGCKNGNGTGLVYVFTRGNGVWSQQAIIAASNAGANDYFGESVALSGDGNTLVVGADYEDSPATGINGVETDDLTNTPDSGAVYVFTRCTQVLCSLPLWKQTAYIKASNTGANDHFGWSVALSSDGNTLAVGAWGEASKATGVHDNINDNSMNDDSMSQAGAVYVFSRCDPTKLLCIVPWSQEAYIKASNTDMSDAFGSSVALSSDGNVLAVGAKWEDSAATGINSGDQSNSTTKQNSGAAYVFARCTNIALCTVNWTQQAYVKASFTNSNDNFGFSVALSDDGNTLAVGAIGEPSNATGVEGNPNDNSTPLSGAAYVFMYRSGVWSQQAYVKASNIGANAFGVVALSGDGNTLAVGAFAESSTATGINGNWGTAAAAYSGAVFLY